MRTLRSLPAIILLAACSGNPPSTGPAGTTPANGTLPQDPATRKQAIDALLEMEPQRIAVYVRVPGSDSLLHVRDGAFPEEVATTFNVLRDAGGHVVLAVEAPFSESGDWDITLAHYFDADGRTFAFERRAGFFNSICTDGMAHETTIRYYAPDGRETQAIFSLKDEQGNDLKREACEFPYDHPYIMYPSWPELAKEAGLAQRR